MEELSNSKKGEDKIILRGKELSETSCLKSHKLENGDIKEHTLYVQMSVFLCLYVFLVVFL